MRVTLVGTGISQGVPVIGCTCGACRSQDWRDKRLRTAAVLEHRGSNIAIDIGPDFRYQMIRAGVTTLSAVLVTHEHSDHIAGLDDIRPFNWTMRCAIPFYSEERVAKALAIRFPYAFMPPEKRYPGAPDIDMHLITPETGSFQVAGLEIRPLRVMHGPLPILGYRIHDFAYITDCSRLPDQTLDALKGVRVLVINALRHTPHPMHFTLNEAIAMIAQIAPDQAYLTHIGHQMGRYADVQPTLPKGVELAYDGMQFEL